MSNSQLTMTNCWIFFFFTTFKKYFHTLPLKRNIVGQTHKNETMKITYLDFKQHATTCWHSTHVPKNAIKRASEFSMHYRRKLPPLNNQRKWHYCSRVWHSKGGSYCAIYRSISTLFHSEAHLASYLSLADASPWWGNQGMRYQEVLISA